MYWRGSASRFPRGEAVAKNGSSEPFLVTEEECGQKSYVIAFVRTSSQTLDVAVPLPTLNPSHTLRRATYKLWCDCHWQSLDLLRCALQQPPGEGSGCAAILF